MMVTMIISLATIFGVYLIITPIVATIFDKQYTSLTENEATAKICLVNLIR